MHCWPTHSQNSIFFDFSAYAHIIFGPIINLITLPNFYQSQSYMKTFIQCQVSIAGCSLVLWSCICGHYKTREKEVGQAYISTACVLWHTMCPRKNIPKLACTLMDHDTLRIENLFACEKHDFTSIEVVTHRWSTYSSHKSFCLTISLHALKPSSITELHEDLNTVSGLV